MKSFSKNIKEFFDVKFFVLVFAYALFVVTFLEIVVLVSRSNVARVIDRNIFDFFLQARTLQLNSVMEFFTFFGSVDALALGSVSILFYLMARKKYKFMLAFFSSFVVASLLTYILKIFFRRSRPPIEDAVILVDGFSFPSGHSLVSVVFYGVLTYFAVVSATSKKERVVALTLGLWVIILISISRVYLGVHWPSDVVSGWILGGVWLSVMIYLTRHPNRKLEL